MLNPSVWQQFLDIQSMADYFGQQIDAALQQHNANVRQIGEDDPPPRRRGRQCHFNSNKTIMRFYKKRNRRRR